jgi:hypothetical protein
MSGLGRKLPNYDIFKNIQNAKSYRLELQHGI